MRAPSPLRAAPSASPVRSGASTTTPAPSATSGATPGRALATALATDAALDWNVEAWEDFDPFGAGDAEPETPAKPETIACREAGATDEFESPGAQIIVGPWPSRTPTVSPATPTVSPATPTVSPATPTVSPATPTVSPATPTISLVTPTTDLVTPTISFATWRQRAAATVIDASIFLPAAIGLALLPVVGVVLFLAVTAFSAWQACIVQGRSGQTFGKRRVGISLVDQSTLAPIGARRSILRQLAHGVDAAALGVGYLLPLTDPMRRTFADRMFSTVVVAG